MTAVADTKHPNDPGKEALTLLEKYPTLAAAALQARGKANGLPICFYPLAYFVLTGYDLEVAQKVYKMHPDALTKKMEFADDRKLYLLNAACNHGVECDTVILFLANHFPDAVSYRNEDEDELQSIVSIVDGREEREAPHCSLELIQSFLDLDPESVAFNYRNVDVQSVLLERLFRYGYSQEVIEYVTARLSPTVSEISIYSRRGEGRPVGGMEIRVLEKIMPQLRSLKLHSLEWTLDGFLNLLNTLSSNTSIEQFNLSLPCSLYFNDNVRTQFRHLLSNHPAFEENTWFLDWKEMSETHRQKLSHSFLQDLAQGMEANVNMGKSHSLRILQLSLANGSQLAAFLSSRGLSHARCILGPCQIADVTWRSGVDWKQCHIAELSLSLSHTSPLVIGPMLSDFAKIPKLKRLSIDYTDVLAGDWVPVDITGPLGDISGHSTLEKFTAYCAKREDGCFFADMTPSFNNLRYNNVLQHFQFPLAMSPEDQDAFLKVVLDCNTALVAFSMPVHSAAFWDKLDYYLMLNQYGRKHARAESTSLETFVDLLTTAGPKRFPYNRTPGWFTPELARFNIVFGLLHEAPASLWRRLLSLPIYTDASEPRSTKRKRGDS
jgi:hypothetical protein